MILEKKKFGLMDTIKYHISFTRKWYSLLRDENRFSQLQDDGEKLLLAGNLALRLISGSAASPCLPRINNLEVDLRHFEQDSEHYAIRYVQLVGELSDEELFARSRIVKAEVYLGVLSDYSSMCRVEELVTLRDRVVLDSDARRSRLLDRYSVW